MKIWEIVKSYRKYDPATQSSLEILFLYPGVKAQALHACSHYLYSWGVPFLPRLVSELGRFFTGIEIHPGAKLGRRVIIDHGAGVVIGETAEVGDDVLIYQGVTLGGTSLERAKRHPTIEANCVIGAGAQILGNIVIGAGSRVGANSVVVSAVPAGSTVVGVPGRIVARSGVLAGQELEHGDLPDPVIQRCQGLDDRIRALEAQLGMTKSHEIDGEIE